jgi:hypothetical protein
LYSRTFVLPQGGTLSGRKPPKENAGKEDAATRKSAGYLGRTEKTLDKSGRRVSGDLLFGVLVSWWAA